MKHVLKCLAIAACAAIALFVTHGKADAASCSMNQTSLPDLIANYDPPLSTSGTAITINAGTLTFTCSGLGTGSAQHVYVELSGSTTTSFVTPSIAMTSPAFTLAYTPCLPTTGTCNGTTNVWQNTVATAFKVTNGINGTNSIPQFSIFVGKQDAYVGTAAQYAGTLYFSFVCGEGGAQAPC